MPLHMTKIAYTSKTIEVLREWVEAEPEALMTTRYLPKRHEEMIGGSLYWIMNHAIVARWTIRLEGKLRLVHPKAKRAHQGWRYLQERDAPPDLAEGEVQGDALPVRMIRELSKLGLA